MLINEISIIRMLLILLPPPPRSLSHHSSLVFPLIHLWESLSILVPLLASPMLFPRCPVVKRGDLDSLPPLM